ncbi:MAG: rhodanese-like domain-containing protein [Thermodesulfobacteriota bacterium]
MKKLTLLSLLTLVFLFSYAGAITAAGHSVITGAELQTMIKSTEEAKLVIIDVREPGLFVRGHIPGAINIPFNGARARVTKELNAEDRNVFVCHGGPMGDTLSAILLKNGFTKVYNLKGGMRRGWHGKLERGR